MKKLSILFMLLFLSSAIQAQDKHDIHSGDDHSKHEMGKMDKQMKHMSKKISDKNIYVCPVMKGKGGKAKTSIKYTYKGKEYYFCCDWCIGEFKKNPEKYIAGVKEFKFEAFQYGFSPEKIEVKKGDIVSLVVTSRDVPHGIYIKEFNVNVRIKKGEKKTVQFIAKKKGTFDILCSIYCGHGHHKMKAKLIVK